MGLDQYLYAKNYLSPMTWRGEDSNKQFHSVVEAIGATDFMDKDIPSVQCLVKVGYWRKCNQIHQWFVNTCQDGKDDCREAYVSRERLEELLNLCTTVIADNSLATELLPTGSGFFFGSTDYDEWYFNDLKMTVEIINNVLKNVPSDWDFAYGSSW